MTHMIFNIIIVKNIVKQMIMKKIIMNNIVIVKNIVKLIMTLLNKKLFKR